MLCAPPSHEASGPLTGGMLVSRQRTLTNWRDEQVPRTFCWWVARACWHQRGFHWSAGLFLSRSPSHVEQYGLKKVWDWWQTGSGSEVRGFTELSGAEGACFRRSPLCLNVIMCEASHSDSWNINYIKNKKNRNLRIAESARLVASLIPNLNLRRGWNMCLEVRGAAHHFKI